MTCWTRMRLTFAVGVILLLSRTTGAVPPHPSLWAHLESARRLYAANPPDPLRQNARLQADGTEYVLVLRVDFPDQPGVRPRAELDRWLFDTETPSLTSYFDEVSYSQTHLDAGPGEGSFPRTNAWYRMPERMSFYGEGRIMVPLYRQLVRDACDAANADVNFADYDRDGDGIVDHLIVLHSGNDEAASGAPDDIWSILVPDVPGRWDGTGVAAAIAIAEEPDWPSPHLGVWFHEFFHDFGAPETYVNGTLVSEHDTQFCVMGLFGPYQGDGAARSGTQPSHICGYLKWDFDGIPENGRHGWITPVELDESTIGMVIPAFSMPNGQAPLYKIDVPEKAGKEFFLIENRNRSVGALFDTAIPDEGLLIWHIDETQGRSALSVASRMWLEDPSDPGHRDLSLSITQDAAYAREDGQTAFTPSTEPNSDANDGSPSGLSVLNIGNSGPTMTFDMFLGDTFEPNDTMSEAYPLPFDVPHDSFLFDAADQADVYRIDVGVRERIRIDVRIGQPPAGAPLVRVELFDASGTALARSTRFLDSATDTARHELLYFSDSAQSLFVSIAPEVTVASALAYTILATLGSDPGNVPPRVVSLNIFPNPVRPGDTVQLAVSFQDAGVDRIVAQIFSVAGSKVAEIRLEGLATGSTTLKIPMRGPAGSFAPGVYFVLITASIGDQTTKRLAKLAVE